MVSGKWWVGRPVVSQWVRGSVVGGFNKNCGFFKIRIISSRYIKGIT